MKVYKVGGAIRDSILGVESFDNDWVVIGSTPEEMIAKGFKPIGKDFPVFLHPESNEEYALARTEKKSGTGYHGFTFYYGKDVSLEEDLSRRDLTINAMAQDKDGNIIDPFDGQKDLNKKIFKHVSAAFHEDPLRAIRLARFHTYSHLKDFSIHESTIKSVNNIVASGEIAELSAERVWSETLRALKSPNPNIYFEKVVSLNLKSPFFEHLNTFTCDSHKDPEIRWSELQINNNYNLGKNLPIPNNYKIASDVLSNISEISIESKDHDLIPILIKSSFKRNKQLIDKLIMLPNLKENKNFISDLAYEIQNTDLSFLSKISKEQIDAEKTKIYSDIIFKCK
jgi:tRNA nucleotidyltransferase/poly(A) polymerase